MIYQIHDKHPKIPCLLVTSSVTKTQIQYVVKKSEKMKYEEEEQQNMCTFGVVHKNADLLFFMLMDSILLCLQGKWAIREGGVVYKCKAYINQEALAHAETITDFINLSFLQADLDLYVHCLVW